MATIIIFVISMIIIIIDTILLFVRNSPRARATRRLYKLTDAANRR